MQASNSQAAAFVAELQSYFFLGYTNMAARSHDLMMHKKHGSIAIVRTGPAFPKSQGKDAENLEVHN